MLDVACNMGRLDFDLTTELLRIGWLRKRSMQAPGTDVRVLPVPFNIR
jgi:hypothetical protein